MAQREVRPHPADPDGTHDSRHPLKTEYTAGIGRLDADLAAEAAARIASDDVLDIAHDIHVTNTSNPHTVTKAQVGLANVPDLDARPRSTHTGTQVAATISDLTKASVGLGNVDNTSDAAKPVSTAQQTALNTKADTAHTHPRQVIVLPLAPQAIQWTNMPAAQDEVSATPNRYRIRYDLSPYTEIRVMTTVSGVGSASAVLQLQYSTDQSIWTNVGPSVSIAALGTQVSVWGAIVAGAKADVVLRVTGSGGDAVADPTFTNTLAQIR